MKSLRIALYVALAFVGVLLWNAWQQEQALLSKPTQESLGAISSTSPLSANVIQSANSALPPPMSTVNTQNTSSQKLVTITTDVFNIAIDPSKGTIVKAGLLNYPENIKNPDQPFILFNTNADSYYIAQTGLTNLPGLGNSPIPFTASAQSYTLQPGQTTLPVTLSWQSPDGLKITKTYLFTRGQYTVQVQYQIENNSKSVWDGRYYMQTQRLGTKAASDHLVGFHTFFGIATSSDDKPYNKINFNDLGKKPLDQTVKGGWLAFLQHYFVSAWVPDPTQNYYYYSQADSNKIYTAGLISPNIHLAQGQQTTIGSKLYIGPELAENLDVLSPHLSLTIDYGWLWFISIIIFWLLKHVHNIIGNWGWSIIVVTIIIKAVFYKLSETSYRSMAKMRALQPKITALKEKFADDRQQLHRATMELYSKEKINPLGGCLPILIQIPVFIALYWVLVESVQLRQAPFILWIHDLSAPDPYFVLPIIMGISMFIQQRLSPPPADPMQAKMFMFLPVFFTVFFLSFPSGLVLYWIVNNVVSILQQWYITKRFNEGAYKKKTKSKKR